MTVLCENCQAVNRDRAMFCIGCAGKLPAFAATGPSMLQSLDGTRARPKAHPVAAAARAGKAMVTGRAPRALVLAVLLLGATVLALASWIGFGPTRAAPAARAPATASAPVDAVAPVASAVPLVPPAVTPVAQAAPPQALPVDASLAAGESTVAPAAVTTQAVEQAIESPAPVRRVEPQRAPQRVASVSSASNGRGAADPRTGCEQLFFVLAARCEARHCDEAAYTRHPRCTVVRAQRERDLARRNLTQ